MLAAMAARAAARAARPTARAAHPSPGMRPLIRLMASGSGSKPAKSSNATGKPAVWTDHGNHYRSRRGHIAPHKTGRSLQPSARPASQGRVAAAAAAAARPNKTTSIVPLRDPFGTPPARDRDAAAPKRTVADENDEAPRPVRKKWGFKKRYQDEETEEIEAGDPNLASLMRSNREWVSASSPLLTVRCGSRAPAKLAGLGSRESFGDALGWDREGWRGILVRGRRFGRW